MTYIKTFLDTEELAAGEAAIPRRLVNGTNVSSVNGNLRLTYFTARKTETITQVRTASGGTAQVGASLCKVGVYTVATNGNITLVASTASDTGLWIATSTSYTTALQASFVKIRGQRYAVGLLVVGSSTAPTYVGQSTLNTTETTAAPTITSYINGQTDLPASVAAGSLVAGAQSPYAVLLQ